MRKRTKASDKRTVSPLEPSDARRPPPKITLEARVARAPRPPDELIGALQDRIHPTSGRLLAARPIAAQRPRAKRTPDGRAPTLVEWVGPLVRQLEVAQAQARLLGLFTNDRDLLTCPGCGLSEDVLVGGQLVTSVEPGQPDTGLRFIEPTADDGPFVCPGCGAEARAQET